MGHSGKNRGAGAAVVLAAAAACAALAGCDPVNGLDSANVSVATDQLATRQLTADHVGVQWLSCGASEDPSAPSVNCTGYTDDQRRITVRGDVTRQQDLKCLWGHLTAEVDGVTVFDVRGLGVC
ncbi:hypothetical protein, partial [Actinacidiphila yeochonensis]|uniref:hypothetical protein n=1 Tax=Actinacidiphila yeochonensis TaxID=89050 RepID=UPI0005627F72